MRERVAGPGRGRSSLTALGPEAAHGTQTADVGQLDGVGRLLSLLALLQPDLVGSRRGDVHVHGPLTEDGQYEDHAAQDQREPKAGQPHQLVGHADVGERTLEQFVQKRAVQ